MSDTTRDALANPTKLLHHFSLVHQDLHELLRVHPHQLLLELQHEVRPQRCAVLEQQQQRRQRERLQQLRFLRLQLLRGQLRRVRGGLERGQEGDRALSRSYFVYQGGSIKLLLFQDATCSITSYYQARDFEKRREGVKGHGLVDLLHPSFVLLGAPSGYPRPTPCDSRWRRG